jgi:hypothetical protein
LLARPRARPMIKIRSKNNLYPHSYFTEHLECETEKPSQGHNEH